jgi:uncharacterized sulfatase
MMPFLNQLKNKSLYWSNCFTLGERSFAVIPNSLGGLPYGDLGFTMLKKYPKHHSLVSLLQSKKYFTAFYTGQGSWFHNNKYFFTYNNVDTIYDNETFGTAYQDNKIIVGNDNFFWGYNDKDLFNYYFKTLNINAKYPYFNTIFTGSTHPPFIISDNVYYLNKILEFQTDINKTFIDTYKKYLKTILFLDDALKIFFNEYQKRKEYNNTIFIITGDHPMTEVPIGGELKKYHVPLIIYSPKLINAKVYKQYVSHLDIQTSILTFLQNYTTPFIKVSTSLGYSLFDTLQHKYAFMNGNREINEYFSNGFFLQKDQIYKVNKDLTLKKIENNELKNQLKKELETFKMINYYTTFENKLINNKLYTKGLDVNVLFEFAEHKQKTSIDEFIPIISAINIPNKNIKIEIDFDLINGISNDNSIVVELKNENDSILFWKNSGLEHLGAYQVIFKNNYFNTDDKQFKLSIYFWNQKKQQITFKNMDILVISEN